MSLVEENLKTPKGNKAGFDYLVDLGITHVQIMPMYDFATVDELHPTVMYNWGYDPIQYNVPEGSYALNPQDGLFPCERMSSYGIILASKKV